MRGMEWGGLGSWVDWTVRAAIVGLVSWHALGLGPSDCLRWPGPSLVDCFGSDRLSSVVGFVDCRSLIRAAFWPDPKRIAVAHKL